MKTYFKAHDFDKDGYVNEKDYIEIGRRFAESHKAATQKKEEFMKDMSSVCYFSIEIWCSYIRFLFSISKTKDIIEHVAKNL